MRILTALFILTAAMFIQGCGEPLPENCDRTLTTGQYTLTTTVVNSSCGSSAGDELTVVTRFREYQYLENCTEQTSEYSNNDCRWSGSFSCSLEVQGETMVTKYTMSVVVQDEQADSIKGTTTLQLYDASGTNLICVETSEVEFSR
ncbi:MAG: hypothetical protein HOI23_23000 [Deltaproteobacteria bacterium]|nr:hypothetical protein [Deltaproteobacteria bacterium]MBT6435735.1 hypothetical protein [Deltaproteobacteria bacterium]